MECKNRLESNRLDPSVHGNAVRTTLVACLLAAISASGRPAVPADHFGWRDAVESALARDPVISVSRADVDSARGALKIAESRFDILLTSGLGGERLRHPEAGGGTEESDVLFHDVALRLELRSGLVLSPSAGLTRSSDGRPVENLASVELTLLQPLLRGRGRDVVTAEERAAARELDGALYSLTHTASIRVAEVLARYWSLAAAILDLDVLQATEASSRDLLASMRRLVEADVTPAADVVQLEADLAAKTAARIEGEQTVFASRQALGREIGLLPTEIVSLPPPSDPLPVVDPALVPGRDDALRLVNEAMARRADLAAARELLDSTLHRLVAARDALEPRLDLAVTPSYTGRTEGGSAADAYAAFGDEVPGLSALVDLRLVLPLGNLRAEGELLQLEAVRDRAALRVERIEKQIGADVPAALDGVASAALRVEREAEAVSLFEQVVENEGKKLRAGSSTVIDLITQRDRLTEARRRWVEAKRSLALAIVELRFQSGRVLELRSGDTLYYEDLSSLPGASR